MCSRMGSSPGGAHMFTLMLTRGERCMCLALWRAKGPIGHSSLSATPFHPLPLSDGLPLFICHSKMTTELHHTYFSCSIDTMLQHLFIVQWYCNGKHSVRRIWRQKSTVTDQNKPNRKYSKGFNRGEKCVLNVEFLQSEPCQMNPLPHKVNRFFCKWFGTLVMAKDLMGIL